MYKIRFNSAETPVLPSSPTNQQVMESWRIFFLVFLIQATSAAVLKDAKEDEGSFTSELSESFSFTSAKSGSALKSVLDNRDADIEAPHTIDVHEDQNKVVDPKPEGEIKLKTTLKEEVVDPEKPVKTVSFTIDPKPKDKLDLKKATVVQKPVEAVSFVEVPVDKQELAEERPKEEQVVQKVTDDEKPVVAEQQTPKEDQVAEIKPPIVEDKQEATSSAPNIIQQGIMAVQQGISNLTTGLTSIIRPSDSENPPPNIIQNLQDSVSQGVQNLNQSIQNIVRPPADENADTTAPPNIFAQGIQNIQNGLNTAISNFTSTVQNLLNTDNTSNPTNILQQGIQSLQNTVAQGVQSINSTIQSFTNPNPDSPNIIQTSVTNLQQGAQNITSGLQGIFTPPDSSDNTSGNILQQLSSAVNQGIANVNQTLSSWFGIFSGQQSKQDIVREQFRLDVNSLNDTLNEGIKNITKYWETAVVPNTKSSK